MPLPPAFLDELRARTPMTALVGRKVKLARSGKSWKGCCPFHSEKSPSFHVYDDGYHCFGCGAHGDAIGFVMNTGGSGFMEAVQSLAAEAGLEVPAPSPQAAEAERQRLDLTGVLDLAATIYARKLWEREGADALAYLRGRGLADDTIRRFGLGWSGDGRGGLIAELGRSDVPPDRLAEAGLLQSRDDGQTRELFYNRVIFPIRDRRGRTISFGGRALGDAKPKYINGPESSVFSKGRTLYAADLAREGARKPPGAIVCEGYMDVIALHQAGFAGAVAPLGTALTADQLELLWRMSDAPVLCFDGDGAGARAALRAAETALPHIDIGKSLRFVSLPAGHDPDTIVREQGGVAVLRKLFDSPVSFPDAFYNMTKERFAVSGPDGRASFKRALIETAENIQNSILAKEYKNYWLDKLYESQKRFGKKADRPTLMRTGISKEKSLLECKRNIFAIILTHPYVLSALEEAFGLITVPAKWDSIRKITVTWWNANHDLDSGALLNHLSGLKVWSDVKEILHPTIPLRLASCIRPEAMPAEIEWDWYHFFGFLGREMVIQERDEALQRWVADNDKAHLDRAFGLSRAIARLLRDDDLEAPTDFGE